MTFLGAKLSFRVCWFRVRRTRPFSAPRSVFGAATQCPRSGGFGGARRWDAAPRRPSIPVTFLLQHRRVTFKLFGEQYQDPVNPTRTGGRGTCCSASQSGLPAKLSRA